MYKRRVIWISLFLISFVLHAVSCVAPRMQEANPSIVTSSTDPRMHEALVLDNGLNVVVISDPSSEQAGASLSVSAGSFQDPNAQPGLAHLTEHMLFMGTEKYPVAGQYAQFFQQRGGYFQAYTYPEMTNYHFRISSEFYGQALNRFSDLFKAPLFPQQQLQNELLAIDNEWSANRSDDTRNYRRILGQLVDSEHPMHRFDVGNMRSLRDKPGSDLMVELRSFYARYYVPSNMNLVLYGPQSTERLKSIAQQYFASIAPKNKIPRPVYPPAIADSSSEYKIFYRPNAAGRSLKIIIPFAADTQSWRFKADDFISRLLTLPHTGGLHNQLTQLGMIHSMEANMDSHALGSQGLCEITYQLTDYGFSNTDHIIAATKAYMAYLLSGALDKGVYQDLKIVTLKRFGSYDNEPVLERMNRVAAAMNVYPLAHVVDAPTVFLDYQPEVFEQVIAQLMNNPWWFFYSAPDVPVDKRLDYYDGKYSLQEISPADKGHQSDLAKTWDFSRPKRNPWLRSQPQHFFNRHIFTPAKIIDSDGIEAFLVQDTDYASSWGSLDVVLESELGLASVKNFILAFIFNDILVQKKQGLIQQAKEADINIELGLTKTNSQVLKVRSNSLMQGKVLQEFVTSLIYFTASPEQFQLALSRFSQWRKSVSQGKLSDALNHIFDTQMQAIRWSEKDILHAVAQLELKDLVTYHQRILQNHFIRIFAAGNYDAATVQMFTETFKPVLSQRKQGVAQKNRLIELSPGGEITEIYSYHQSDSGYLKATIDPLAMDSRAAHLAMLAPLFSGYLKHVLRTQKGLAYNLGSQHRMMANHAMLVTFVQSPRVNGQELALQVALIEHQFYDYLAQVRESQFEQARLKMLAQLQEKPKNSWDELKWFYWDWQTHRYQFDSKKQLVEQYGKVTLHDVVNTYKALLIDGQSQVVEIKTSY